MTLLRQAARIASVCFVAAGFCTPSLAELPRQEILPLSTALKMIDACVALAEEKGWAMNVAIVDAGDNLLAYARMEGSAIGSQKVAMLKASTSARGRWATSQLSQFAFDPKTGAPNALAFAPDNILFPGGLPIASASGQHLGGIGVSGSMPQDDEACAKAGLDAVTSDLK